LLRARSPTQAAWLIEMTWGDGGRATVEYGDPLAEGEAHAAWRRIGSHAIFEKP
jgi:hypothetical protein